MGHISVLRALFFWGIGAFLVMIGFAGIISGAATTGMWLILGGFALVIINKVVFRAKKVQLEIDSDEAIKRLEKEVERLEKARKAE